MRGGRGREGGEALEKGAGRTRESSRASWKDGERERAVHMRWGRDCGGVVA